jgi:hypothetical protein
MRSRRSGVEDRWCKKDGTSSANRGKGKRWRARYVDDLGHEHAQGFDTKREGARWLDQQTATLVSGTHVAPRDAQITVSQWCTTWLQGYGSNRAGTVRAAKVHIRQIEAEFGDQPLSALRPSQIKSWVARLKADGLADSYVYALHRRLSQIMDDAWP